MLWVLVIVSFFDKILLFNHSNSFCFFVFYIKKISKELSDSFYCMPFLLGDPKVKEKLTVTYCKERSSGRLIFFQKWLACFLDSCELINEFSTKLLDYAPVICIPGSLGAGDSGDIAGPMCRDLTFDESRQCRRCAGVLISRQNANLCHILTTRGKLSL